MRHHRLRAAPDSRHLLASRLTLGGALITVGAFCLVRGTEAFRSHDAWLLLPALLAWSGLARIVVERRPAAVVRGVLRIAVAAYLWVVFEHVGGWTFAATWPALVIAAGVATVARALFDRSPAPCEGAW